MTTYDKPDDNLITQCVLFMQHERSLWVNKDPRIDLEINSEHTIALLKQLRDAGQCVIINDSYLTAWMIYPQWHNPDQYFIQELVVIKFADGGTLANVVDYYTELANQYGAYVQIGDLLSSRQAAYGRALRMAGATPFATSYTV